MWPKLKFYGGFDDEKASNAEVQGSSGKVLVEFEDGRCYEVSFEEADKLKDWIDRKAKEQSLAFEATPGLILVQKVTLKNMRSAVKELSEQGEFGFFTYLKEWDPEKEKRYHDKYFSSMEVKIYEYPSVSEK